MVTTPSKLASWDCEGLTSGNVHHVIAGAASLHHIHHHAGEAQVVLGEQRVDGDRLHHVAHEEEALGVLEAALGQVPPGATFVQRAALQRGGVS